MLKRVVPLFIEMNLGNERHFRVPVWVHGKKEQNRIHIKEATFPCVLRLQGTWWRMKISHYRPSKFIEVSVERRRFFFSWQKIFWCKWRWQFSGTWTDVQNEPKLSVEVNSPYPWTFVCCFFLLFEGKESTQPYMKCLLI